MSVRDLLLILLVALVPTAAISGEPVRLDATELGTIAIDPEEALAARKANDPLRDALSSGAVDLDPHRGARLDGFRQSRSARQGAGGGDAPGEPADE